MRGTRTLRLAPPYAISVPHVHSARAQRTCTAPYASSVPHVHGKSAYASSAPHIGKGHTVAQYCSWHSSIRYLSTAHRIENA
eukprot:467789-Rhodomonas_salina.1